jgi:hypothetical protein
LLVVDPHVQRGRLGPQRRNRVQDPFVNGSAKINLGGPSRHLPRFGGLIGKPVFAGEDGPTGFHVSNLPQVERPAESDDLGLLLLGAARARRVAVSDWGETGRG